MSLQETLEKLKQQNSTGEQRTSSSLPSDEATVVQETTASVTEAPETMASQPKSSGKTKKYGNTELPIRDDLTPDDLKYVPGPSDFVDNQKLLHKIAYGLSKNAPILLIGETGTGKTSAARYICHHTNMPFRRINLSGGTTADELIGKTLLDKDGTYWVDGELIDAMRKGHVVVLDEINAALPEVLFILHSLLDDDGFVVLSEKDGEVVRPHANFRVIATMNPPENYAGTKHLNKALLSRFTIALDVPWPTEAQEKKIVRNRIGEMGHVNDDLLDQAVKYAREMRTAYQKGLQDFVLSPRDLIAWLTVANEIGDILEAAAMTLTAKCGPEERKAVEHTLKIRFGITVEDYAEKAELEKGRDYEQGDIVVVDLRDDIPEKAIPEEHKDTVPSVALVKVVKMDERYDRENNRSDYVHTVEALNFSLPEEYQDQTLKMRLDILKTIKVK